MKNPVSAWSGPFLRRSASWICVPMLLAGCTCAAQDIPPASDPPSPPPQGEVIPAEAALEGQVDYRTDVDALPQGIRTLYREWRRGMDADTAWRCREAFEEGQDWTVRFQERPQPWIEGLRLVHATGFYEGGHDFFPVVWLAVRDGVPLFVPRDTGTADLRVCDVGYFEALSTTPVIVEARTRLLEDHCVDLADAFVESVRQRATGEALPSELLGFAEFLVLLDHEATGFELISSNEEVDFSGAGMRGEWLEETQVTIPEVHREDDGLHATGYAKVSRRFHHEAVRFTLQVETGGFQLETTRVARWWFMIE